MAKINSISVLGLMILTANKAASPFSILVFISSYRILNWIVTIQELYYCVCFLLQNTSNFLTSKWEGWSRGKNADATTSTPRLATNEHVENETISREDLERVMGKLGIFWEPSGEENHERLDLCEISTLFDEIEPSLEEVKEAFDLFDENKDGFIDAKELEKMLCALGFKETSESECQRMIMAFDYNGDGRIDFSEFLSVIEYSFCKSESI